MPIVRLDDDDRTAKSHRWIRLFGFVLLLPFSWIRPEAFRLSFPSANLFRQQPEQRSNNNRPSGEFFRQRLLRKELRILRCPGNRMPELLHLHRWIEI
jgi:hypothetical protein